MLKSKKRQGWEALSHNAPHILRELQLHFKVITSHLIFIYQRIVIIFSRSGPTVHLMLVLTIWGTDKDPVVTAKTTKF